MYCLYNRAEIRHEVARKSKKAVCYHSETEFYQVVVFVSRTFDDIVVSPIFIQDVV